MNQMNWFTNYCVTDYSTDFNKQLQKHGHLNGEQLLNAELFYSSVDTRLPKTKIPITMHQSPASGTGRTRVGGI